MPLNWLTDPLLYDEQPTHYNDWVTANALIELGEMDQVVTKELSFTNLYGIMVRKIDFVRTTPRDRIIARFPFIKVGEQEKEDIQLDILNLAEVVRNYFYKSINKSILQWKDIIQSYLQKGTLPYPIYRCSFEFLPEFFNKPYTKSSLRFSSARGETFSFPTKLSNKLAYLCGVCNGDGNLRNYWVIIVDETRQHIKFVSDLLFAVFDKEGNVVQMKGAWAVKLNLLWAVRLINFLTDQTINTPKYDSLKEPLLFKRIPKSYRALFWRGAFDADGSFKTHLDFCSKNYKFAKDFQLYLKEENIQSNFKSMKGEAFAVKIHGTCKYRFAQLIGTSHIKKMNDFQKYLIHRYPRMIFQALNKQTLTLNEKFFNFLLLPTLQVIGLDSFFQEQPFFSYLVNHYNYDSTKGVTIKVIQKLFSDYKISSNLMSLLHQYKDNLLFRFGNSPKIRLPLQPKNEILEIMSKVSPTQRGLTILEEFLTANLVQSLEDVFGVKVTAKNKVKGKLLSTFFLTFGVYCYKKPSLENEYLNQLQNEWEKTLEIE